MFTPKGWEQLSCPTYDAKGQLIRHDSATQNASFTYSYDKAGNITAVSKYAYTTGTLGTALETKNYTYATGTWGDLLTTYNGKAISYDAIGNMTSYDGATFTWEGRSLASLSKGGSSYTYQYNADGIRTGKTVNGTTTEYFLNGSQILAQKTDNSVMWFFYDGQGMRTGLVYNGHFYYYLYNVQGDVVALADSANGQLVARYNYDAWGKCTVTNASGYTVGDANPFRYRGYYYDAETELYYLNSRYYDPELKRFISSDTPAVATASPGSATWDKNLFAYCDNDPVVRKDDGGQCWEAFLGAAIAGAAVNLCSYLVSSKGNVTLTGAITAIGTGAAVGAMSMVTGSAKKFFAVGAGIISGVYSAMTTEGSTLKKITVGVATGLATIGAAYLPPLGETRSGGKTAFDIASNIVGNTAIGFSRGTHVEIAASVIKYGVGKLVDIVEPYVSRVSQRLRRAVS